MRNQQPQAISATILYNVYGGRVSDCTNGGVTAKHNRVLVLPLGVMPTQEQLANQDTTPILKVVSRFIGGRTYLHAEPINSPGKGSIGSWMFGGNYVHTSDSRFSEWINQYPIAVHDRTETPEQYRMLSI